MRLPSTGGGLNCTRRPPLKVKTTHGLKVLAHVTPTRLARAQANIRHHHDRRATITNNHLGYSLISIHPFRFVPRQIPILRMMHIPNSIRNPPCIVPVTTKESSTLSPGPPPMAIRCANSASKSLTSSAFFIRSNYVRKPPWHF